MQLQMSVEFEQAMRSADSQTVLLRVVRNGTGLYIAVEPQLIADWQRKLLLLCPGG